MLDLMLDTVKTGSMLATINPNGKPTGNVWIVGGYSTLHKKWGYCKTLGGRDVGVVPNDGAGYYSTQNPQDENPVFYFSANPAHVKAAISKNKKDIQKIKKKKEESYKNLQKCSAEVRAVLKKYNAKIGTENGKEGLSVTVGISGYFLAIE